MELRSPLSRARGLGAAKEGGMGHWWAARLTAIALVPLMLWFVVSAIFLVGADHAAFKAWVGAFGNPVLLILLTIALYHHAQLGLQEVIEDYVHHEAANVTAIVLVKLGAFFCATFTIFSIVRLTFGG
ncbi:MAG: succinate dehydrogenase, hydrophobic membrane anchor protein [Rhodospirillales bacterium]